MAVKRVLSWLSGITRPVHSRMLRTGEKTAEPGLMIRNQASAWFLRALLRFELTT